MCANNMYTAPTNYFFFLQFFLFSGGGDGHVVTWDARNRKRITQYSQYPTSISALAFNFDGSRLAIASSYTYERGDLNENEQEKDRIYIRVIKTEEVEEKKRKGIKKKRNRRG